MKRCWIVCVGLMTFWSASMLLAKPGIVKTRDGRTLEGDVTEKTDVVIVTIRGIPTSIARENLESMQYVGTIDEQYKRKLAELPKIPTSRDHLDLARWLFDSKAYELARTEADAALQLDANNAEAQTLSTTIQGQLRLDRAKTTGATPVSPVKPATPGQPVITTPGDASTSHTASMHKYLSLDEINLLKQAEWSETDTGVKTALSPEARKKYVTSVQGNVAAFSALSPADQARQILENGTNDQRKEVKIVNDPAILAEYKRTIQPMILTGCATAGCHGGTGGGKLFLYGTPENDAATYTNFYLLMKCSAQVGGAQRMMIDPEYPEKSLIVEFGLPSELSKVSHPEVKGAVWRSMFRSPEDGQYKTLMRWMGKLVRPEPKYGFDFSLEDPVVKPTATAPASKPTPIRKPAPPK